MYQKKINVAVIGATGYVGLDLTLLLSRHPKVIVKYLPTQKVDSVNCVKAFLNSDKYEFNGKTIQNFKIEIFSQNGKNMLKSHFEEPNKYSWPKNLLISSELRRGKTLSRGTYIVKLFYYSQLVSVKTFEVL